MNPRARGKVAALVLAAGSSTRFGSQKLLAPFCDSTLIRTVTLKVTCSHVDHTLVVLGREGHKVRESLADLPLETTLNPDYALGLSTSLRHGLRRLDDYSAVVVILGDQPGIATETIDHLLEAYRQTDKPIVCPYYRGVRGHPVLFDHAVFPELMAVSGDKGGRAVLHAYRKRIHRLDIDSPLPEDIDVPEDLERLHTKFYEKNAAIRCRHE